MPRAALARALGTNETQIKRWETQNAPPAELLEHIAKALNFQVTALLGMTPSGIDLTGKWHATWQTTRDGIPTINRHELTARHSGDYVYFAADGDYDWNADLKLRGMCLTGDYQAVDISRNEIGSLYFTLNHHGGDAAIGGWRGQWVDGIDGSGHGVLARDPNRADRLIKTLIESGNTMVTEWPREA
jgi:transcriptional regulator with XRE-family HTH domain